MMHSTKKHVRKIFTTLLLCAVSVVTLFASFTQPAHAQFGGGGGGMPSIPSGIPSFDELTEQLKNVGNIGIPGADEETGESEYYDGPSFDELFEKYATACAVQAVAQYAMMAWMGSMTGSVPDTDWGTNIKELVGDCIVSATKNALMELITGQAVGWAQRGYGGNPSFVQNIGQYLRNIADSVAGEYIAQTTAGEFLCSPFRAEIQLALTRYYQQASGRGTFSPERGLSSCTLTQVTENVDAFINGDFYSGGWEAWIEMSSNPYNTSYGAYLQTVAGLEQRVVTARGEAQQKLNFASGFLSKEVQTCYGIDTSGNRVEIDPETIGSGDDAFGEYECDPPQTVTPGDTIKTSLEKVFGTKLDSIVQADEINEILSLVAAYMLNEILSEDEGLARYDYTSDFDDPLPTNSWAEAADDIPTGGGGRCTPTDPTPGTLGSSITYTSPVVNDLFAETIPLPSGKRWGDYRRVTITFDLTVGPWNGPGEQYNVVWLNRGGNDWGGGANRVIEIAAVRGSGTNLRAVTQVDSCTVNKSNRKSQSIALQQGETYTFEIDYEPAANRTRITVRRGSNQLLSMNLDPTVDFLSSTNSKNQTGYYLQLGAEGSVQGNEGNTNGWRWSDITVEFEPGN